MLSLWIPQFLNLKILKLNLNRSIINRITTDFVRAVAIQDKILNVANVGQLVYSIKILPFYAIDRVSRMCKTSKLLKTDRR